MTAKLPPVDARVDYRLASGNVETQVRTLLATLSFWGAITVPLSYVPLVIRAPVSREQLLILIGLVSLHGILLYGGRNYNRA